MSANKVCKGRCLVASGIINTRVIDDVVKRKK